MNNYEKTTQWAKAHFLEYGPRHILTRPGIQAGDPWYQYRFLGTDCKIHRYTGEMIFTLAGDSWTAGFAETLSVYDRLCDGKPQASAAGEYCPVSSLPGILVGGSGGLVMEHPSLAAKIDSAPERFCQACRMLGGQPVPMGDLGFRLPAFPDLAMQLKFYHADEEFPPTLTLMWDRNTLDFVRYETVYYIASALSFRLERLLAQP